MVRVVGETWTMAEAAGASARAIRQAAGATLAEVAKVAKTLGLPWSSGRVGDFESGRIAPSLPTLLAVAGALSQVSHRGIALADLFAVEGRIAVNDEITLRAERLQELLRGKTFEVVLDDLTKRHEIMDGMLSAAEELANKAHRLPEHLKPGPSFGVMSSLAEGDHRLAKALGVDIITAAAAMSKAWDKSFVNQRDHLAGPDANAQRKGIIARKLKADLRAVIDGNDQ